MFYNQINAPATLPIYLYTSWKQISPQTVLYTAHVAFFCYTNKPFEYREVDCRLRKKEFHCEPLSQHKAFRFIVYMCVMRFACIEFSYCKSRFTLLLTSDKNVILPTLVTDKRHLQCATKTLT